MNLHTDHLTEAQQLELFNILQQESPLLQEATSWEMHAYLNEESYRQDREEWERQEDQKRWDRLYEMEVLINPDNEVYEWDTE